MIRSHRSAWIGEKTKDTKPWLTAKWSFGSLCLLACFLVLLVPRASYAQRSATDQQSSPDTQQERNPLSPSTQSQDETSGSQSEDQSYTDVMGDEDQGDQQLPQDIQSRFPNLVECRYGRTPQGKCKQRELPDGLRRDTDQTRRTRDRNYPLRPEKPEPPNDFQKFVQEAVGLPEPPPLFGRKLFERVPSTFAPADQIPVTADYVIGTGDQLLIRAWGQVNIDYSVTVDRNGNIFIPDVGSVNVSGIKYSQLHDYLASAIGRVFHNFDLAVTMGQLRSIQVLVVGQARRPGSYTVSALSTIINALFASGGPSVNGSMRHIQLKRGNQLVTDFDMYDLLLNGDKSKDKPLQNGDVIFIPPIGSLVAVTGSVNVPAIYEVKDGTELKDVLRLAGGITTTGEAKQVTVERIVDHAVRRVNQFTFDNQAMSTPMHDGDLVRVLPLISRFDNAVTLRGNVSRVGRYPWHDGMKITDLIPNREALIIPGFWQSRNSVGLAVSKVGQKSLRTEVKRDAPDINWGYAVIERLNLDKLTTTLIPFNLGNALADPNSPDNKPLEPDDVVTVFSQADFPVPIAERTVFVRLEGEFAKAGVYQAEPGEHLLHLIDRVGGLTANGYLYGLEFTRESVKTSQQDRLKELIDRLQSDLQAAVVNQLSRPGNVDSAQLLQLRIQNQEVAIQRLKEVQPTGRIAFDLRPTQGITELPDLQLEDGDVITVPSRPSTVTVLGAVYSPGDVVYTRSTTIDAYVRQAGGPTRDADPGRMYIIRASGIVRSRKGHPDWAAGSFGNLRLMPGDTVIVPTNPERVPMVTQLKDWSQIFSQFALAAAGVKVLLGL